jgi:hypothetical protein
MVRVVSYRLIDDAAGSEPPSIQEARTGNRESGKSCNDPFGRGPGLDRGEPVSGKDQSEGKATRVYRDTKRIGAQKHRPQYGIARRFKA